MLRESKPEGKQRPGGCCAGFNSPTEWCGDGLGTRTRCARTPPESMGVDISNSIEHQDMQCMRGIHLCLCLFMCGWVCDVRVSVNSYQMNVRTPPCKKIMSNIRCEVIMILVREIKHIQANHWSYDILEYTITGEHDNKRMLEELYVHWVRVLHICTPKLQLILINLKISFKIGSILKILKPTRERNNSIGNGCDFMFARHSTCK